MAHSQKNQNGNGNASLPSLQGDAHHTLVPYSVADMMEILNKEAPACVSTALSLLRRKFPERPVSEHQTALGIYQERLF